MPESLLSKPCLFTPKQAKVMQVAIIFSFSLLLAVTALGLLIQDNTRKDANADVTKRHGLSEIILFGLSAIISLVGIGWWLRPQKCEQERSIEMTPPASTILYETTDVETASAVIRTSHDEPPLAGFSEVVGNDATHAVPSSESLVEIYRKQQR